MAAGSCRENFFSLQLNLRGFNSDQLIELQLQDSRPSSAVVDSLQEQGLDLDCSPRTPSMFIGEHRPPHEKHRPHSSCALLLSFFIATNGYLYLWPLHNFSAAAEANKNTKANLGRAWDLRLRASGPGSFIDVEYPS